LVRLGRDGHGEERFTSREMIAVEERLHQAAEIMAGRERHWVRADHARRAMELAEERSLVLSREQRSALVHVTERHDLAIVVGYAGSGKSAMLGVAREAWEESGYQVRGLALSGIAAENLESGSGIASRTIASMEHQWGHGRELLSDQDVLVIDEAGMIGSRQMERVLGEAQRVGAKVVLVGDPEQLQAIEAGAAFRSLVERHPHVEVRDIRRQQESWQQDATRQLATGHTGEALEAYREHGMVQPAQTRDEARERLVEGWNRDRTMAPDKTRIILTHTNDEVAALNNLARGKLRDGQELGLDVAIRVERGDRTFASGDRVMFLKNDQGLGIKNGSLGEVESVTSKDMTVRLDAGRSVAFDLKDYAHLDHGYAATIHKAQGVTVDRVHVLATPGLDRHSTYVALSRHRDCVQLHYGQDDFADDAKLVRVLSRERAKDMAGDYERESAPTPNRGPDRAGEARSAAASPEPAGQAPAAPKRGLEWGGESDRAAAPTPQTPSVPQRAERTEPPKPGRSIFAGFKPKTPTRVPGPEEGLAAGGANGLGKAPDTGDIRLGPAVQRYARALNEIAQARASGNPELPHQREAWVKANNALDAIRPHAAKDLHSAFETSREVMREAIAGRPQRAIQAMQVEAEIRTNPALRADRFVARWQDLDRQRMELYRSGDWQAERTIKASMGAMGKSLERDPQVESLLRNRVRELGIPMDMGRGVGASMIEHLGLGRGRGLGL